MAEHERAVAEGAVGRSALLKTSWRILPLLGLGYGVAYMDRINIGFASLQMNRDLHFSATVYGLGGSLFFLSYALFEVPSNIMLLKVGARRWIARIMLTWGVLAAGMMYVRTPTQFYAMRFLLGAAEAGYFPGVLFYLMQWFPASERGRAISRFYVAFPLSSVVMGAVAGALLNLQGRLGLSGWQWLFLAEGLPAILLSAIVLVFLPESPQKAAWLSEAERAWITGRLDDDTHKPGASPDRGAARALLNPLVWTLGICNMAILSATYSLKLFEPALLQGVTHLDATHVGFLISAVALVGALSMIAAGWHSDKRGERYLHVVVFLVLMALAYGAMGLVTVSWLVVAAYAASVVFTTALQAVFYLIPSDLLHGRSAASSLAAIGSIGMMGAFVGPAAMGWAKDHTGGYQVGLASLALPLLGGACLILLLRGAAPWKAPARRLS